MPSSYHRDYANAVSNIYGDMGRAQANARLQQGQGWANAFGQIGQSLAAIPGQIQEQKQQNIRNELTDLQMQEVKANLARAQRQDAETMAIADLISQATINGQFDQQAFATAAAQRGMGQIVPQVVKTFAESQRALLELEEAQKRGQLTDAQLVKLQQDYLRPFAIQLWEHKFDPSVVNGAFAALKSQGVPDPILAQWKSMPAEDFSVLVQQLLPRASAPEPVTLSEGQVRLTPKVDAYGRPLMGPDGQPVMDETRGPDKPKTLDQLIADAARTGNTAETRRLTQIKASLAAAERGPQRPSFSRAEIVLPDGTIKTANYDSSTGKYTDIDTGQVLSGVGRAPTDKDVAAQTGKKQLSSVVAALTSLSEQINTLEGVAATARGAVEQQKARVNLNDNVAEYEAIIAGFTPIVARAVGHTGVLTQMDVDSVKAMFPSPKDSKSLRDRKVARLNELLQLGVSGGTTSGAADLVYDPATGTFKKAGG